MINKWVILSYVPTLSICQKTQGNQYYNPAIHLIHRISHSDAVSNEEWKAFITMNVFKKH